MLTTIAISNYRSLRNVVVPLRKLNVITGANGAGKSNLYRAMRLLADVAQGRIVASIAREGGLQSILWAGPEVIARSVRRGDYPIQAVRRKEPVRLRLGFASDEYGYAIDLGLPTPNASAFALDPQIKRELIWHGDHLRPSALLVDREGPVARIRTENGDWSPVTQDLTSFDSMMTHASDPRNAPEMLFLRESIRAWRFYDHFRMDAESPVRIPQVGTWTPVLGNEGLDVASAVQTILELGDGELVAKAVEDAFPGSRLLVEGADDGRLVLRMAQKGLLRPLSAGELSDGTLRYILWIAALLTPRPPKLMVLNEPETSLHPDLMGALARLMAAAAKRTQLVVVTHAKQLIAGLEKESECYSIRLAKSFGQTTVASLKKTATPTWKWPDR